MNFNPSFSVSHEIENLGRDQRVNREARSKSRYKSGNLQKF